MVSCEWPQNFFFCTMPQVIAYNLTRHTPESCLISSSTFTRTFHRGQVLLLTSAGSCINVALMSHSFSVGNPKIWNIYITFPFLNLYETPFWGAAYSIEVYAWVRRTSADYRSQGNSQGPSFAFPWHGLYVPIGGPRLRSPGHKS